VEIGQYELSVHNEKDKDRIIDFAIIGVCKGGTESAVVNLSRHPEIDIPHRELNFFNRDFHLGVEYYRQHFDYRKSMVGEKTPHYYMHEDAISRLRILCPNVRLILMLRDPVKRLFSHWHMLRDHYLDLANATGRYAHRDYPGYVTWIRSLSNQDGSFVSFGDFVSRRLFVKEGFYMDQIEMILTYFPRRQLHVAISEHVKKDMEGQYAKMFEYLGCAHEGIDYQAGVHSRKYTEKIDEKARRVLKQIYKPHNERLFRFLGHQIPEWQ
jgi:hypothetical protein